MTAPAGPPTSGSGSAGLPAGSGSASVGSVGSVRSGSAPVGSVGVPVDPPWNGRATRPVAPARLARYALGVVRLVMGGTALLSPRTMAGRLDAPPGTTYALRLFGIRTVIIGVDLLAARRTHRDHAVRWAPVVHASDTLAALAAGRRGELSHRAARTGALISGLNTVLALVALAGLWSTGGPARRPPTGPGQPPPPAPDRVLPAGPPQRIERSRP